MGSRQTGSPAVLHPIDAGRRVLFHLFAIAIGAQRHVPVRWRRRSNRAAPVVNTRGRRRLLRPRAPGRSLLPSRSQWSLASGCPAHERGTILERSRSGRRRSPSHSPLGRPVANRNGCACGLQTLDLADISSGRDIGAIARLRTGAARSRLQDCHGVPPVSPPSATFTPS